MNNSRKKAIIIFTLSVLILLGSFSYAIWTATYEQKDTNIVTAGCFEIQLTEETDAINLTNSFPISDGEGQKLKPYIFSIKNTCTIAASYDVYLDILDQTTFNLNSIKVKTDVEEPNLLANLDTREVNTQGVASSYFLTSGVLAPATVKGGNDGGRATHYLRLWIDSAATEMEKQFVGKIVVSAVTHTAEVIATGDISKTKDCPGIQECDAVNGNNVYYEYYDDGTLLIKGTGATQIENDYDLLPATIFFKVLEGNQIFADSITEDELAVFGGNYGVVLLPIISGNYNVLCQLLETDSVKDYYEYMTILENELSIDDMDPNIRSLAAKIRANFPPIRKVIISEGITEIGFGILSGFGNYEIKIPNSVIKIDANVAMLSESILSFNTNSNLQTIMAEAFSESYIDRLILPSSVEYIYNAAFGNSKISSVSLPANPKFTAIEDGLFDISANITEIILPTNITEIKPKALLSLNAEILHLRFYGPQRVITSGGSTFDFIDYDVEWNYNQ